jgi:hypothetical protein
VKTKTLLLLLAAVSVGIVLVAAQASADNSGQQLTAAQIAQFTAQFSSQATVLDQTAATADPPPFHEVKPHEFDPGHTILVQAEWSGATGCPTNAKIAIPNSSFTGVAGFSSYSDPACMNGDPKDDENDGLVLVKTGPTSNFAAAIAELKGVKGITLTELGYDIRKPGVGTGHIGEFDLSGSHCGAGAPRFNIQTTTGFFFIGCNSADMQIPGDGWTRLRWGASLATVTGTVKTIFIVFDEGQDASGGPDSSGAAVLDNIDVNGTLVGHGPDESEP